MRLHSELIGDGARTLGETHCPFCALQCRMSLSLEGAELRARGVEFPVNLGALCIKGANSPALLTRGDRLKSPLVRAESGSLRPASWEEALDRAARLLGDARASYGNDAVGVFGSGALSNEVAYLLGKFARVALQTPHIDYNGRFCMSSAAGAMNRSFGLDRGMPFPVSDIEHADCIVTWGSNWADTLPPIAQWFQRQQARGGTLVTVDPRRTATGRQGQLCLQLVPGSDLALANGLLFVAIEEGLVDHDYIATRTEGWEALRQSVLAYWPARAESLTGITEDEMRRVVRLLATAPRAMLLTGRGPEQQAKGVDTLTALINLMLILGKVGKPYSGFATLTGQGNGQGGREHGQKCDQLPGYRSIRDEDDRRAVAEVWGIDAQALPPAGRSAVELFESFGQAGGVRALLLMGSNIAVAAPNAARVRDGLRRLDGLVVVDAFLNDSCETADVVLPSCQWLESSGTVTNLEGRVLLKEELLPRPSGVKADWEILQELARRLGCERGFAFRGAEEIFDELRRTTTGARADYSAVSYGRLRAGEALHWPCGEDSPEGTPRLFLEGFPRSNGRALLLPVAHREIAEAPDDAYPWYLTTGRYREHYNSGAQTRGLDVLSQARPKPTLQVHPALLESAGLLKASRVRVVTRRGSAVFEVELSRELRRDTLFLPFHWGGDAAANLLTVSALDPVSRMPEYKICAARLEPVDEQAAESGVTP